MRAVSLQEVEVQAGSVELATSKLREARGTAATTAEQELVARIVSGKDTIALTLNPKEARQVYGGALEGRPGRSLVVCSTVEVAREIGEVFCELGVKAVIAHSGEVFAATSTLVQGIVIAPLEVVLAAYREAKASHAFERCVVDSIDLIVRKEAISKVEAVLTIILELRSDAQLILVGEERSATAAELGSRFLRNPQMCPTEGAKEQTMEHVYYEVGTSLLAKPQALCDILELEGGNMCIVFCNSPSDADFADVILKKRGISSIKLVGYVPQIKLSKAIQQIQKKEVSALVLTDVAARGVPLEEFQVVVNYSVPTDPEVYFHRYSESEAERKTKKVISLVAALDLSNFHYLKKLGKLEFVEKKLPTPEELFASKFTQLKEQAIERGLLSDAALGQLVDQIMGDSNARDVVALLLHNTITVLPSLKAAPAAAEERGEFEGGEEESYEERGGRGGNRQGRGRRGGRDRRDGRDSRDNRGNRDDYSGDDEDLDDNSQAQFLGGGDDQGERQHGRRGRRGDRRHDDDRGDRRERGARGDRGDRGERGEREPRQRQPRKPMIVDREARLYVGVGAQQGVSTEALTQKVVDVAGIQPGDVHRISVRPHYSFIDVPEAVADQVVEKLGDAEVEGKGSKYYVKRAVTLSIPREGAQEETSAASTDEFSAPVESRDMAEEGPTLLAVDETA
jgi:ATP-dependent RNA helicase DeaD